MYRHITWKDDDDDGLLSREEFVRESWAAAVPGYYMRDRHANCRSMTQPSDTVETRVLRCANFICAHHEHLGYAKNIEDNLFGYTLKHNGSRKKMLCIQHYIFAYRMLINPRLSRISHQELIFSFIQVSISQSSPTRETQSTRDIRNSVGRSDAVHNTTAKKTRWPW